MAIALESVGSVAKANGGNLAPGAPAGGTSGDVYICLLMQKDNVAASMTGDWTPIYAVNNGATSRASAWWHRRAGADPDFTITRTGGNSSIAAVFRFSGCRTTGDPTDGSNTAATSPADTPITAPDITPTQANDMVIAVAHAADNGTCTAFDGTNPTFSSEDLDDNTNLGLDSGLAVYTALTTSTSALGARTATYTLSALHIGGVILLREDPPPPPPPRSTFGTVRQSHNAPPHISIVAAIPLFWTGAGFVTAGGDILNTFRHIVLDPDFTYVNSIRGPSVRAACMWDAERWILAPDGHRLALWEWRGGTNNSGTVIVSGTNIGFAPVVTGDGMLTVFGQDNALRRFAPASGYWTLVDCLQVRSYAVGFTCAAFDGAHFYTVTGSLLVKQDQRGVVCATAYLPSNAAANGLTWDGHTLWVGMAEAAIRKYYQVDI